MIAIVLLLTILSATLIPFSVILFELTALCLLLVPIEAFLLGKLIPASPILYGSLLILNIGLCYLCISREGKKISFADIAPVLLWLVVFVVSLAFCHRWPDFMSMGERIRDYALLSELMKYPFTANEPWMTGENLNYYLYWYRFGSMLGSLLSLPTWEMYHILQSVTFSLFIATIYRILSRIGGFSVPVAAISAIIIGFGSNVQGISHFLKGDENWWGPSRVIPGAINEFPAWSFLLGDLHPHYLNLTLFPLIVLFMHALWKSAEPSISSLRIAIVFLSVGPLIIYNSNAWEVPILGIFIGFLILFGFFAYFNNFKHEHRRIDIELKPFLSAIVFAVITSLSLYLSSRNITTGGDTFKLVRPPIAVSALPDLFLHWGIPLTLISIATIGLFRDWITRGVIAASILAALFASPAIVLISFLITFTLLRVFVSSREEPLSFSKVLLESLGLLSLTLLFLPEVFFLDDPYGGENERMNTIFKAYSANWALIHIYAFYLTAELWKKFKLSRGLSIGIQSATLVCAAYLMLGFFHLTQNVRKSNDFHIKPIAQGLSQLDTKYPGAGEALKAFAALPDGVTVEAQGNAYSMTSHVSTLGGKRSYLGWMNHVDLLTRKYDESKRRAQVTSTIYNSTSCEDTRTILTQEGIRYLVVGPLEREQHPMLSLEQFNCLKKIIETQSYVIFESQL